MVWNELTIAFILYFTFFILIIRNTTEYWIAHDHLMSTAVNWQYFFITFVHFGLCQIISSLITNSKCL